MIHVHVGAGRSIKNVAEDKMKDDFIVKGFFGAATKARIKKGADKKDLALIYSERLAYASGMFTTNKIKAAPVIITKNHLKRDKRCKAILINSGNANAVTGDKGIKDAKEIADQTAKKLKTKRSEVLLASTGVIGEYLPMGRILPKIEELKDSLKPEGLGDVAEAIMTTDTRPKISSRRISIDSKEVSIVGMAKGAGMIRPNMATMLCFVLSDVSIDYIAQVALLKEGVNQSFHAITIDGDTSTNDTLLFLSNGSANNFMLSPDHPEWQKFKETFFSLLKELAFGIVKDGEGATKFVTIHVDRAKNKKEAKEVAFNVANSPLVKTAFFGEDVNWGRIACAVGYSKAKVDPKKLDIFYGNIPLVIGGIPTKRDEEARSLLLSKDISVTIRLNQGEGSFTVYTTDLSYDYVKINASYKS